MFVLHDEKKERKNIGWTELYTLLFTKHSHLVYELRVSLLDSTVVHLFISGINVAKIMDLINNFGCWSDIDKHCLLGDIDFPQLELNLDLKRNVYVGGATDSKNWWQQVIITVYTLCFSIFSYTDGFRLTRTLAKTHFQGLKFCFWAHL